MSQEQREEEMISGFSEITGCPADNSRCFLESANWNLELALIYYYDAYPDVHPEIEPESDQGIELNYVQDLNLDVQDNDDSNGEPEAMGSSEDNSTVVSSQTPMTNPNVNPSSQGGVEAISHEPGGTQSFAGQGYRLGHSTDDSNLVNPDNGGATTGGSWTYREVILRLWRDGFSVDSGPLYRYSDPEQFLSRIRQGHVPVEAFPQLEGGAAQLFLEDHRHENYVATAIRPTPFTGRGDVLGSAASEIHIKETEVEVKEKNVNQPVASSVKVDESSPKTTVQIRLPGGDKIQVTLNQSHTIADLRAAIMEQLPQYRDGNFRLMTAFPSRELNDNNMTLQQADILQSSILLTQ